jgi:hypothetical protein
MEFSQALPNQNIHLLRQKLIQRLDREVCDIGFENVLTTKSITMVRSLQARSP